MSSIKSTITINGRTVVVQGNGSVVKVHNGRVTVNGQVIEEGLSGTVDIRWEGPAASIEADGSVECGAVSGSVAAGGSVQCGGGVGGNVSAGGSVNCGNVTGNVSAGGSVVRR